MSTIRKTEQTFCTKNINGPKKKKLKTESRYSGQSLLAEVKSVSLIQSSSPEDAHFSERSHCTVEMFVQVRFKYGSRV